MLPAGCPGEDPPIRWRWDPLIVARMLREASCGEVRLASGAVAAKRGWRPSAGGETRGEGSFRAGRLRLSFFCCEF
jgi:hypothetical protein